MEWFIEEHRGRSSENIFSPGGAYLMAFVSLTVSHDFSKSQLSGNWKTQLAFEARLHFQKHSAQNSSANKWSTPAFSSHFSSLFLPFPTSFLQGQALKRIMFRSRSILAFGYAESSCIHAPIQFNWSCTNICPSKKDAESVEQICFSQHLYQLKNEPRNNSLYFQIKLGELLPTSP